MIRFADAVHTAKGPLVSTAVRSPAETITRVAHPDANIIFGAVIDDALGDEVRVTVIAAGFDKLVSSGMADSRLSRLLEEPSVTAASEQDEAALPSLLEDDEEDDIFKPAPETVVFDAEEDLDIPDFLKN